MGAITRSQAWAPGARPEGEAGQEPRRAMCSVFPGVAGPASGADQRIAPGLVVQLGDPGLAQGLNAGVCHHPASPSVGCPGGPGGR